MIRVTYSGKFLKSAKLLPLSAQEKLAKLIEAFQMNPFAPILHTKKLSGDLAGFYSFRITRDWRVIFQFVDFETIQFLRVGHRGDIYR